MTDIKHICKESDFPFERGSQKKAYAVKECVDFTSDKDTTKMVIVNFTDEIKWISTKDSLRQQRTRHREQILKFKTKMINDPQFKYRIRKLIDKSITENPEWEKKQKTFEVSVEDFPEKTEFPEIINIETLINWFENYDEQFDIINELKKMNEFGKMGLAPILYQIRINNGAPFSPDEIDAQIAILPDNEPVQISYMVEKCGGDNRYIRDIHQFVHRYPLKEEDVARKLCKFCDEFVDKTEGVNCDFKYQNLCPMIVKTKDKRDHESHEIMSIRMLDVDPKYTIEKKGDPVFSRHGKVFMKFLMFAHLRKRNAYFFKWGISVDEVREMIAFFYGMDYMIYQFNPINMMYHYLIKKSDEEEIHFDILKTKFPTVEEMIAVFEPYIRNARPFDDEKTVFDVAKGGKSKKARKSRKARKAKRTHRRR
jgi:hypothetical protein